MVRRFLLILLALTTVSGCAGTQPPKVQFAAGTRVGIINHLEPFAIHQNFAEWRLGSFSRTINVNWNIPAYIEDQLTQKLKSDSRCAVVPIQSAKASGSQTGSSQPLDQISIAGDLKPEDAAFLNRVAEKHNLDVLIIIKNFRGPGPFKVAKHPIILEGYGLFTRERLISKEAYAYANIAVMVFQTKPLIRIGLSQSQTQKSSLDDFNLSGDLKSLPQSEVDKLEPIIKKFAEEAAINALESANLVSSK